MEIVCEKCNAKLNVPDEKIPQDQVVHISCPKCKNKLTLDTRSRSTEPEKETPPVEEDKGPDQPKESPGPVGQEEDEEIGFFEEGIKLALVMENDEQEAEKLKQAVEELGYKYVSAENTRKAVSKMRLHHFDLVILSDRFDGVELGQSPILQYMNHTSMPVRRRIFLAIIGNELKTMDNMLSFAMSANLVINRGELDKVTAILKRGISENETFYKVYMDMLVETGKV